jgi:hypothetical protein
VKAQQLVSQTDGGAGIPFRQGCQFIVYSGCKSTRWIT